MDNDNPRQRLIRSAVAVLTSEGVEAVTLRRIAREAGVSHGAPLRHFTGRAELLAAVAASGFAELRRRAADLPDTGPQQRLLTACRRYLDFALENPAMFELMFRTDLIDVREPELARLSDAVFEQFLALVTRAQAGGWRRGTASRPLAASLWAALHGLAALWSRGGLPSAAESPDVEHTLAVTLNTYLRP
ncbi:TetR/AcrR family transcriptional regulator [Amycolatopsis thermophila]|uniref:AcrR family transcriptional regulator n=1 Tax=Amycolatopsis thermophila TaxID=206084 RepID=A0ABU0EUW2_9PSEU|nr:TetR/AcrR family transcriptional regulator [Amycolatopsis thermophila]MDQ0379096.1 AcrR family transcriptional regulator [Amycolatopsis thermophila]